MKVFDYPAEGELHTHSLLYPAKTSLEGERYRRALARERERHGYATIADSTDILPGRIAQEPEAHPEGRQYSAIMGQVATGVAVVTAWHYGRPIGFTINAFNAISHQPGVISFCADNTDATWPLVEIADRFCVNILAEQQKDVATVFARKGGVRFQATASQVSTKGIPVLAGILAWIECNISAVYPAGNAVIVLGEVEHMHVIREGRPLISYKGTYGTFEARV